MFQGIVFIVLFACLLQQIQSIVAIQIACNREYYGAPNLQDCEALLSLLPYDDQERLFDEEQLRLPDSLNYPGVDNVYPSQVFQIPAYWSLRTCNLALMSYSVPPVYRVALGLSSWKIIAASADDLLNRCLFTGPSEGGSTAAVGSLTKDLVLRIIIWASGSSFDSISNDIQNEPRVITPGMFAMLNGSLELPSNFPSLNSTYR